MIYRTALSDSNVASAIQIIDFDLCFLFRLYAHLTWAEYIGLFLFNDLNRAAWSVAYKCGHVYGT